MEIIKDIAVDLYQTLPLTILAAKQGDTGRGFRATITAGDEIPDFSSATIAVYIKKPDGTKIYNACTADGNVITGELTNQALAVPGEAEVELQMQAGDDILSTPIFTLLVLPSNIDDSAIESQDEFDALQTALSQLSDYNAINTLPLVNAPSAVTSLADAFEAQPNHRIAYFRCSSVTTDKAPGAQNAGVLSYRYYGSAAYGAQLSFSAVGLYVRACSSGTWSDWFKIQTNEGLTGNRAVVTNGSGILQTSAVTATELGRLSGVTANVQTTLTGLRTDLTTEQGKVSTLQGQMTTAQGDITDLQGDMTTAQGDITDLQDAVTPIGTLVEDSKTTFSVTGGSWETACTLSLGAGTWQINGFFSISIGQSGQFATAQIVGASSGSVSYMRSTAYAPANIVASSCLGGVSVLAATTNVQMNVYSTAAVSLQQVRLEAVRIK